MASNFRPVNTPMTPKAEQRDGGAQSPTTPTPTRTTFGQRPLPTEPFPKGVHVPDNVEEDKVPQSDSSQRPQTSRGDSEDVDMDDSDGEGHENDDGAGSDDESVNADGTKSNKKKKSQRFWCMDYPPCNLSFTRSEHLARHIRKHTGERPFQCHCMRRFSRLDNLRQHAQTVHVNEDIPIDSLAASGTRFQRQLRTERVRQPGRARASTAGSLAAPTRGHSKSLSTSSISSVGSNFSTRDDIRRRPTPLIIADPRYHQQYPPEMYHQPPSPVDFNTPISATFSTGQNSPRWTPTMASPTLHSRSHSLYAGSQTHVRRLSVPSGGIPFHSQPGANHNRPTFASHSSPYSPASSSVLASPISSAGPGRRESTTGSEDWRRRTWHLDSMNFNVNPPGSRLSQVFTPSQYPSSPQAQVQPPAPQHPPEGPFRLPGIDSFGPLPHRPATPSRNNGPQMIIEPDRPAPPNLLSTANTLDSEEKRSPTNWAMSLHKGLTRLDIASNPGASDNAASWTRDTRPMVDTQDHRPRPNPPTVRFRDNFVIEQPQKPTHPQAYHQYTMSAPSIASSRESKRRGWHHSGASAHAEAPPEKMARVERMVHPNIREFSGFPARQSHPSGSAPREPNPGERSLGPLETLVAVATGEGNTTKAY